jgi:hypothetical protein
MIFILGAVPVDLPGYTGIPIPRDHFGSSEGGFPFQGYFQTFERGDYSLLMLLCVRNFEFGQEVPRILVLGSSVQLVLLPVLDMHTVPSFRHSRVIFPFELFLKQLPFSSNEKER